MVGGHGLVLISHHSFTVRTTRPPCLHALRSQKSHPGHTLASPRYEQWFGDTVLARVVLDHCSVRLARISHHPPTATAQWHVLAGFRSVGVLDIVSTMPARSSIAKATHAAPLHHLATNGGEKCGLAACRT